MPTNAKVLDKRQDWTEEDKAVLAVLDTQLITLIDTAISQIREHLKKDMIAMYKAMSSE